MNNLFNAGEKVTTAQLSKVIGMPQKKIAKLCDEGLPHFADGKKRLFDTVDVYKWLINYNIEQVLPDEAGYIDFDEAKRRGEVAKALQAELALAKEREQVANIDDLMVNFASALTQVRAKLISMPSRLSGILSHQDDESVSKILEDEITDTLESLSEYKHEYTGNKQTIENKNNSRDKPMPIPMPKAATKT